MSDTKVRATRKIARDGYTWYLYLMFAICGYHQSVLGSITPFLRDEMALSKTEIGWHFGIYAVGLIVAGHIVKLLSGRYAVSSLMAASAWFMVGFIAVLAIPLPMVGTLIGALCLGLSGGTQLITIQETLARHHGDNQGIALTEGCVFGGLGVFIGPLVIGVSVQLGLGWRETLIVPMLLLGLLYFVSRGIQPPHLSLSTAGTTAGREGRLPLSVILVFGMILFGISTEWGVGFWGAQFLEVHLSVSPETGVTLMSAFFGGTVIGRIFASQLLQIFEVHTILIAVIVFGGGSVFVLWLMPVFAAAVTALVVAGMCLGNFFPLILSIANELAPEQPRLVSAGATQSVGLALLIAPVLLGQLGESIGLSNAVGLLAFLPLAMLLLFGLSISFRSKATA